MKLLSLTLMVCYLKIANALPAPDNLIKCSSTWVPITQSTFLDKEAMFAGYDPEEKRMYVGRAFYDGYTIPGMISETQKGLIEFKSVLDGKEIKLTDNFDYFKENDPKCYCGWYPHDTVKLQQVVVRDAKNGEEWWIGTAKVGSGYVIGKASEMLSTIFFVGENKKVESRQISFILQCSPKARV